MYANGWLFYDWVGLDRNELYASDDPNQLTTLDDDPEWDTFETSLSALTEQLKACAGASCSISWRAPGDEDPVEVSSPTTVVVDTDVPFVDESVIVVEGSGPAPTLTARSEVGALQVSWEPIENAKAYRYRVGENGGEPSPWTRVDLATELELSDLDSTVDYTVEVSARRGEQWRRSNSITASPLPG